MTALAEALLKIEGSWPPPVDFYIIVEMIHESTPEPSELQSLPYYKKEAVVEQLDIPSMPTETIEAFIDELAKGAMLLTLPFKEELRKRQNNN